MQESGSEPVAALAERFLGEFTPPVGRFLLPALLSDRPCAFLSCLIDF